MKSGLKNDTEVTLDLSLNLIRNSNDVTNFPHILLFNDKRVSRIRKTFANGSSSNMKFSSTQFSKMIQLRWWLTDDIGEEIDKNKGLEITITNNEIKDIMKVIKSLENRGILLKGTTRKIAGQEWVCLNFLGYYSNDSWFTTN